MKERYLRSWKYLMRNTQKFITFAKSLNAGRNNRPNIIKKNKPNNSYNLNVFMTLITEYN